MKEYIDSYLPYVYKETTKIKQLSRQMLLNHKYFCIFTSTKNTIGKTSRLVDAFHVISMISANMFILAMLFDIRYPVDDGSCVTWANKTDCLNRKTVFNTYCEWQPSSSSALSTCTFSEPKFDLIAVITLAWLQLIISVPIKTTIHYLFDNIIYAATAKLIEKQIQENQFSTNATANRLSVGLSGAMQTVSRTGRRMSKLIAVGIEDARGLSMRIRTTITVQANFADLR